MVDFKKFLDPEYQEQRRIERQERERIEAEKEAIRQQTAMFTGHRKINGSYDWGNESVLQLKDKLLEVVEDVIVREGKTRFISGGALGTDQIAFWCVHKLKDKYPHIKNIVAIPFENQDKIWSDSQKSWYKRMLNVADEVINVEELREYLSPEDKETPLGEFSKYKMSKRNEYMVDHSSLIIAVYDGSKSGTANCLYYAKRAMRNHTLYRIHPKYMNEVEVSYMM